MSRYGLPDSVLEGFYRKDGSMIRPKGERVPKVAKTPAEVYWLTLGPEEIRAARKAMDWEKDGDAREQAFEAYQATGRK